MAGQWRRGGKRGSWGVGEEGRVVYVSGIKKEKHDNKEEHLNLTWIFQFLFHSVFIPL